MKKFSDIQNEIDINVIVDCIWLISDVELPSEGKSMIIESKFFPINGTKYSYRIDPPRGEEGPGNRRHIHIVLTKNHSKEIFAYNSDMTAHDGCHGVRIPDEIIPIIVSKGFKVPENHIIEMMIVPVANRLLTENIHDTQDSDVIATFTKKELNDVMNELTRVIGDCEEFTIILAPIGLSSLHDFIQIYDCYDKAQFLYESDEFGNAKFMFESCCSIAKLSRKYKEINFSTQIGLDTNELYSIILFWR